MMQRAKWLLLLSFLFVHTSNIRADLPKADAVFYPDHSNLLVLRDAEGRERPITTKADWAERLKHIRANME